MNEKQRLEKVLAWVNKVRKEHFGAKPLKTLPKGKIDSVVSSPIAIGISRHEQIGNLTNTTMVGGAFIDNPLYVRRFIHDFDNGKYPNLIKRG